MKILTVFAVIAIGVLAWQSHSQYLAISDQRKQIQEWNSKLAERGKTANLELQEKCAAQAARAIREDRWRMPVTLYENHYNSKLNRCFVRTLTRDSKSASGSVFVYEAVHDAFEGRNFGDYSPNSGGVPLCKVTLPSGETKICNSREEFDFAMRIYME